MFVNERMASKARTCRKPTERDARRIPAMRSVWILVAALAFLPSMLTAAGSCSESECGFPRPFGPTLYCSNGSVAGVVCANVAGTCQWQEQECASEPQCVDLENAQRPPISGTLRQHPTNPRFATMDGTTALLLAGAHTWDNGQDLVARGLFDDEAYLDLLDDNNNNFIRLWVWEAPKEGNPLSDVAPFPWEEVAPGLYDLSQYDQAYLDRVRSRIEDAAARNILVSVMLFQHHSNFAASPWNVNNNVNGIDGVSQAVLHTCNVGECVRGMQKAYITRMVAELNQFDNFLWEIGNEIPGGAGTCWQTAMVNHIRNEESKPLRKQHLITVNSGFGGSSASYTELLTTGADSIAYASSASTYNPTPKNRGILTLADTDHLKAVLSSEVPEEKVDWVWKSFMQGMHPLHMEATQHALHEEGPYSGNPVYDPNNPAFPPARAAMGLAVFLGDHVDLASLTPAPGACSTGNCLVSEGSEYLVYAPTSETFTVPGLPPGEYLATWLDAKTGRIAAGGWVSPPISFDPPFGQSVLHLSAPANPILAGELRNCPGD